MRKFTFWLLGALCMAQAFAAEIDFTKDIQPILENKCSKCHNPDKQKGAWT